MALELVPTSERMSGGDTPQGHTEQLRHGIPKQSRSCLGRN